MNAHANTAGRAAWLAGLAAAWPVALGYLPVAVAFGALGVASGLSPWLVQLISLTVFAGASQFAFAGLIAQGTSPLLAAAVALALNVRHAFYGPALRPYLRGGPLAAFVLTDEVFAVALQTLPKLPQRARSGYLVGLGLGAYAAWNTGTALGAFSAEGLAALPYVSKGLSFALPALFLLLALPYLSRPIPLAAGTAALALHLAGHTAWGLLAAGLIGLIGGRR